MPDDSATFVFADIAGFTSLTEAHGDEHAAALVDEFCATVDGLLPAGATRVKTIGDAVMLRVPDPAEAILLALRLASGTASAHGASPVRVGLHHGSAIERDGDYLGATVNLAARVASVAAGGEVLTTGETAVLAPGLEGVLYESRGRQALRNVREPVELFAVRQLADEAGRLPVDPVCGMAVDPEHAPGRLTHDGTTYFFCSLPCAGDFAGDPGRFVAELS
jgi:adenylate cyclase